jgi:hypothetical protein
MRTRPASAVSSKKSEVDENLFGLSNFNLGFDKKK